MKNQRFYLFLLTTIALLLWVLAPPAAAESLSKGKGDLRVMTYNVDEGTDYNAVQQAGNLQEFLAAVGQTISEVRASDPHGRIQAAARQIIAARPTLVSLQELDQWSTGPFDPINQKCGPVSVEFDMLPELMAALDSQGAHYKIAKQETNWTIPPVPGVTPSGDFLCVQVIDYIAILARTDIDSKLHLTNEQSKQFDHILIFHSPLGDVPFARSWVSVDATFNNKSFRFIGTHLDSVDPGINQQQGEEIRLGPANTSLPVIVAMDANSQAYPSPQGATYVDFMAAGFQDVWSEARPGDPGLTCCLPQPENNFEGQLYQRIDLILTFGNIEAQRAARFGIDESSQTPGGLWPSDHTAVAAQLAVESDE